MCCMLQRDSAGVPGGAVEKLSGHAGANAGRQGLSCDWVLAGEGQCDGLLWFQVVFVCCSVHKKRSLGFDCDPLFIHQDS